MEINGLHRVSPWELKLITNSCIWFFESWAYHQSWFCPDEKTPQSLSIKLSIVTYPWDLDDERCRVKIAPWVCSFLPSIHWCDKCLLQKAAAQSHELTCKWTAVISVEHFCPRCTKNKKIKHILFQSYAKINGKLFL